MSVEQDKIFDKSFERKIKKKLGFINMFFNMLTNFQVRVFILFKTQYLAIFIAFFRCVGVQTMAYFYFKQNDKKICWIFLKVLSKSLNKEKKEKLNIL